MTTNKPVKRFGFADKFGYMFGDFGNDCTFILSSSILMKFYSDVMGVSVGLIGIMMMVARIVDAFTDVTMGQIADRSRPRAKGKFLPWIRRMCGPVAVASFLMYATWFKDMPMAFKIFWMFFTYLLWGSVFYTSINIPYGSMASAISGEPKDRASLSNWRTIGATLAGTVIGVILPLIVYYTDENGNSVLSGERVTIMALILSILAVICYMLCYTLTTERVKVEQKTEKFNFFELISSLVHNRALIGIVAASICMLLVQLTSQTMNSYVYPNYFGNTTAQSVAGVAGMVVTFVCAAFTVPLSQKFGRKELAIFATGILSLGGFSSGVFAVGGFSAGLFSLGGLSVGLLLAIGGLSVGTIAVGGLALGIFAIGGGAFGIYALGGAAVAQKIAAGGAARAVIAIGDAASGEIAININDPVPPSVIRDVILTRFPETWEIIVKIFSHVI